VVLRLGTAVVNSAVKTWLTNRKNTADRTKSLADLVNARITGDFPRRRFNRELEALVDVVAERLMALCHQEIATLDEGERQAALAEVKSMFEQADLADADLFAADMDATKLMRRLRSNLPDASRRAGLSDAATWFYGVVLEQCCVCYIQLVVHLTPFAARASAELLGRVSGLSDQLGRVLERLPAPTLMAPQGMANDEEFRDRYLRFISETQDEIELFGVDTQTYRSRTTLSVAYISLSVSGQRVHPARQADELIRWRAGSEQRHDGAVRVEQALAANNRILIRGEAGSGKSTLLRWLAVSAARGAFRAELADLNGHIPFLVKLRSHAGRALPAPEEFVDGPAQPLAALMPQGFVHRQLAAGRALVLVDGVDELPANERGAVRDWLGKLSSAFPDIRLVLTSRPAGASESWLKTKGFESAVLERMSPTDVRALIRHWHQAARDAGGLPCDDQDLPRYEGALLSRLDSNPHLQAIATTPLLCALLCALNLDRRSFLPRNRLELYVAALSLLLDRRDSERGIPGALTVTGQDRRQLLRHLAWRLSVNGRSELTREDATRRLAERLAAMPRVQHDAEALLDHLVLRSGVVREPVAGRIDFVHRTFQDFLTAEEAADQGDIGLLVQHGHLDQWRDIVVMTAGLANAPLRNELVAGLLDRADTEPRMRRRLQLLAASAMEAAPALTTELAHRMDRCWADLLPPRRTVEARTLATAGEILLPRLPTDPASLSEATAAAIVRTAALINGPEVWPVLEKFSQDPRPRVQKELIAAWRYFDPDEYASRVLADAPLLNGHVRVEDQALLPAVAKLRNLTQLEVDLRGLSDLEPLAQLPRLERAQVAGDFEDLAPLSRCTDLVRLLVAPSRIVDPLALTTLPRLESLCFYPSIGFLTDLDFLRTMTGLTFLALKGPHALTSLAPIGCLSRLTSLSLYEYPDGIVVSPISSLTSLEALHLGRLGSHTTTGISGGVQQIAIAVPQLRDIGFLGCNRLDLAELTHFSNLNRLSIRLCDVDDLTPLTEVRSLRTLQIAIPIRPGYLGQIRRLPQLTDLEILSSSDSPRDIDLAELGDVRLTVHTYANRHRILRAGKGVRLASIG
jgi:hypothetical protein